MKKSLKLLAIATTFILTGITFPTLVKAKTTATVTDPTGAYIRSGPGTNNNYIGLLGYTKQIELVSTTKYNGAGCNGWYQVIYNNTKAYICSELVAINSSDGKTTTTNGYYLTDSWGTRISEDYANVRKTASANSALLDRLYMGTKIKVLEKGSTWTKISYYNGKTGYVLTKLVKSYEDITATDTTYNEVLKQEGFPESYWPFLTYLHQKHPDWIFKADKIDKKFQDVVANELGKNYIQTNVDSYRTSNTAVESGTWYIASSGVVAVYLDPRNYLNETNIFAFEKLSYDKTTQTSTIVESILDNTYLHNEQYIKYFMEAAQEYNISPVHLAARVKQEGGTDESYDGVSGVSPLLFGNKPLKGYYNYYNIGAFGSNPVARGLAVAGELIDKGSYYGTPWDTREKAIKYGAKFIADGYINNGQDNLYYQKFNTNDKAYFPSYTHQYMTNIVAPASESLSTYSTYTENKLMNTKFTFYIPVYKETPKDFTTLPPIGDTNNSLKEIKINNENIVGFDKDVLEYTHYVTYDTTKIKITANAESTKATVKGIGDFELKSETQEFKIAVTSETGEEKTYKITIIKQAKPIEEPEEKSLTPDEITNKMDIKFSNGYMSYISVNTTATSLINEALKYEPKATITITSQSGTKKTNTILATGDIITITSGKETKKYTIVIKGDTNGDGKINAIDLLRVQKHILKYSELQGAFKEACDTNYDSKITSIDLLRVQKHILKYSVLR